MEIKRLYYLDVLRIIGTIAVIIIHVSAQNFNNVSVLSNEWNIFNIYDSLVRWGVPIFVMISGTLFLQKDFEIIKIYHKYLLRLIIAFIFWSIIYAIYMSLKNKLNLIDFIYEVLSGHYHMWYIFMISGLYIITPLLKKIAESKNITRYYIILATIFTFIINMFIDNIIPVTRFANNKIVNILIKHYHDLNLNLLFGYTCYYLLGYYLSRFNICLKKKKQLYLATIICLFLTTILTLVYSRKMGYFYSGFYNNLSINTMIESVGIYTFIKDLFKNKQQNKFLVYISKHTFGIYLVHVLIIDILDDILHFNTLSINPIISIPFITIATFIISLFISIILKKIPLLKKYIV